jgi:hypothetical protein
MSVPVILRAAPVATNAQKLEPETVRHHELYERTALRPRPGLELGDVPICVGHDKDARIGRVTALRVEEIRGDAWLMVHAALDEPPAWLRKFETAVSISRAAFDTRTPWGAEWELVQGALLVEVSLLRPGTKPAFAGARVEWVGKPQDSQPAGEIIYHTPGTRVRRTFKPPAIVIR